MKEAAEKREDFPWSLHRISQMGNWCKLVRRVSICRAGRAGHGWNLNYWWCGSRNESCWGTCCFASTHPDADNADCGTSRAIFTPVLFKQFLQVFKLLHSEASNEHKTRVFTAKKGKRNEMIFFDLTFTRAVLLTARHTQNRCTRSSKIHCNKLSLVLN